MSAPLIGRIMTTNKMMRKLILVGTLARMLLAIPAVQAQTERSHEQSHDRPEWCMHVDNMVASARIINTTARGCIHDTQTGIESSSKDCFRLTKAADVYRDESHNFDPAHKSLNEVGTICKKSESEISAIVDARKNLNKLVDTISVIKDK
jgi:hypothetical protein